MEKHSSRPPSCTTPRQPTIYVILYAPINLPDIKRNDSDRIPSHDVDVLALVVQDKGVHSIDENLGQEFWKKI